MKEQSDDILELVYNQLVSGEISGEDTSIPSSTSPPSSPPASSASSPAVQPSPSPQPSQPTPSTPQPTVEEKPSTGSSATQPVSPGEVRASTTFGESDPWDGRKKVQLIVEFILTYGLAKKYGKPVPIITASIEDTINLQKVMLAIENDINHILEVIAENWESFKDVQIEVDWEKNSITIKPKE